MNGREGMKQEADQTLHGNDRNFGLRMRLLDQAHRDALWRLKEGHAAAVVVAELRDAYRLAEQARPITSYR